MEVGEGIFWVDGVLDIFMTGVGIVGGIFWSLVIY